MEAWMLARIEIGPAELAALAASRAEAVRAYLANAGIEATRLFVKGGDAGAANAGASRVALDLQ
jgi:outer membrane protein OmpA-like peptidoglycan-associated protein